MLPNALVGEKRQRRQDQDHPRALQGGGPLPELNRGADHPDHRSSPGCPCWPGRPKVCSGYRSQQKQCQGLADDRGVEHRARLKLPGPVDRSFTGTVRARRTSGIDPKSICQDDRETRSKSVFFRMIFITMALPAQETPESRARSALTRGALQFPRLQDGHQARKGQDDGDPLQPADLFPKEGPGHDQGEKRHGINEDRRFSDASVNQRQGGKTNASGGGEKSEENGPGYFLRAQRCPSPRRRMKRPTAPSEVRRAANQGRRSGGVPPS